MIRADVRMILLTSTVYDLEEIITNHNKINDSCQPFGQVDASPILLSKNY